MIRVEINKRKTGFVNIPKEQKDTTVKHLSAYIVRNTRATARGLSRHQEYILLPPILGISPSSPEWEGAVSVYWENLTRKVGAFGITLNTKISEKGAERTLYTGEKVKIDIPENLEDYAIYQRVMGKYSADNICPSEGDPYVAKTDADMDNIQRFDLVLIDEEKEKKAKRDNFILVEKATQHAMALYKKLDDKETYEEVKGIIYLIKPIEKYVENMSIVDMKMYIKEFADNKPEILIDACNTKNLAERALVIKSVEFGVIQREGNTYMFDDAIIGESLDGAAAYLKDERNQHALMVIQTRLRDKNNTKQ